MKKILIAVGVFVVAGGYLLSQYWYYLPGIIAGIVAPVGENQAVVWERGVITGYSGTGQYVEDGSSIRTYRWMPAL